MKYAYIENNKILGWYDDDIHDIIPTPNIEVSDEQWKEAININANCYEDRKFIVKDFRTVEEIEKQRISSIKAKANELIEMVYPIYKQNNILMSQIAEDIKGMNAYILNIRNISNEAEAKGTKLEDIDWGV